jgi:predicted DNA-binding protein (MmcQ/YjbR family)
MGKMFALVPLERLPSQANLKCDPEKALELREAYDGIVIPGYHMSKKHWNTIYLENLPLDFVVEQIEHSYELVVNGLTKKLKEELQSL